MIPISLTDFVDFAISTGTPKLTKVRQIKNRPPYHPALDFYGTLRNGIIDFHKEGGSDKSELDTIINRVSDSKKVKRYNLAIRGYKKFLGRKKCEWFEPPSEKWGPEGIEIKINPELGLAYDGKQHIIKMYFKADQLSKRSVDIIVLLLYTCFSAGNPGAVFGVVDVQRGKFFSTKKPDDTMMPLLIGEAVNFKTIWDNL